MVPIPRPYFQFRLSTLLWITLAVACWFGGIAVERWLVERGQVRNIKISHLAIIVPAGSNRSGDGGNEAVDPELAPLP